MTITPRKSASILAILLAGGAMLLATSALARGPGADIEFGDLDLDGNGEITSAEFESYKAARIAAIDTDGDGFVTLEEMTAMRRAMDEEKSAKRFEKLVERADENDDGRISLEEMAALGGKRGGGAGGIPRGMDADGDGSVSAEEFAEAKEKRKDRRSKRGHGDKHNKGCARLTGASAAGESPAERKG